MHTRRFRPHLAEVAVIVAGILVACYAYWVIRDVGSSGPDVASPPAPTTSITESPSASPTPEEPAPIAPFRRAVADAETVLVVGDASGDNVGEWVDLWAGDFAQRPKPRQVTLHTWDAENDEFVIASVRGTGRALDIWDLSYPGTRPDYAQHLDQVPEKPGAVVYSLGHDRGPKQLTRAVSTTASAVTDTWGDLPTAYVLQNPATGEKAGAQEAAVEQVRGLAATNGAAVIDVAAAFAKADSLDTLVGDDGLPTDDGSRLWADTVTKALR